MNNNNIEEILREKEKSELEFYRNYVDNLAKEKKDYQFPNSSQKHASIVMSTIFKHAKKQVYIYDDNLNGDIANYEPDFYDNVENFLKNDGELKIVINNEINENTFIYFKLKEFKEKNYKVELKKPNKNFIKAFLLKNEDKEDWYLYFTSADNRMIRIEKDNKYKFAFCNFNDSEKSEKLIFKMESNLQYCTEIL